MKKSLLILILSALLMALVGCSEAYKLSFTESEYTVTEGDTFTPEVKVSPKKAGYELFSGNNTILTVEGEKATALKPGIVTLTARSGDKEATATVYVLAKSNSDVNDPTFPDPSYITFSVINYTSAQLESEVIRTLTLPAGTDITESFPSLTGYELSWFSDENGRDALPEKVLAPSGQVTYYAVARARLNRFLTDEEGRVTGLEYPNLDHKTLVFPASYNDVPITGVADRAFYGDTTIESIVIPVTFTYIGKFAFAGCTSLTSVRFAEGSTLTEIGDFAFGPTYTEPEEKEEEEEEDSDILSYLDSLLDSVGLTQLSPSAGKDEEKEEEIKINEDYCAKLADMELPASVKKIGSYAFYNCSSMHSALPDNLETISYGAFRGSKIASADLHNVKKIEAYAFYDCTELAEVTRAEKVEECGGYAFHNTALYNKQIKSNSVVYAGSMVVGCYGGKNRVELLFGTTLIADYAFNNKKQDNLTVLFNKGEPVRIGWQSFYVTGYRSGSTNQPIFSDNLFLAVGEGETESYASKYPLLSDKFCERVLVNVEGKDNVNFGVHSLLKLQSGKYAYDLFTVGTTEGKFFSPYEIDLSRLEHGSEIVRLNAYSMNGIAHLTKLNLARVETVAEGAVSACANLKLIDLTGATVIPTLLSSASFLFSGFSADCIVRVTKDNYNAFYTAWEGRTTARSRLAFVQNVSLYVDGVFDKTVEMDIPSSSLPEEEGVTWYLDEGCATPATSVPAQATALYGKTN